MIVILTYHLDGPPPLLKFFPVSRDQAGFVAQYLIAEIRAGKTAVVYKVSSTHEEPVLIYD